MTYSKDHIFFTADTHFNHEKILQFSQRPFASVREMNEILIENWNKVVGKEDIVFHLGDFSVGRGEAWTEIGSRLNGHIHLILGNHDMNNFNSACTHCFEEITMQKYIEVGKRGIYLNHYPFLCYSGAEKRIWQLFGHMHTNHNNRSDERLKLLLPRQYDVGVDNNNFTPVSYLQVKQIIERQIEDAKRLER